MTPAGQRDKRITFQRAVRTRSSLGTPTAGAWSDLGARWAKVLYGSGAERRQAATEQAVQPATFRVLADTLTRSIIATDRISFDGLVWDITNISPIGRPAEIEFTATANRS